MLKGEQLVTDGHTRIKKWTMWLENFDFDIEYKLSYLNCLPIETPTDDLSMQQPLNSPVGVNSPPSYADVLKNKSVESSGS